MARLHSINMEMVGFYFNVYSVTDPVQRLGGIEIPTLSDHTAKLAGRLDSKAINIDATHYQVASDWRTAGHGDLHTSEHWRFYWLRYVSEIGSRLREHVSVRFLP